jgi:hypothetical protein
MLSPLVTAEFLHQLAHRQNPMFARVGRNLVAGIRDVWQGISEYVLRVMDGIPLSQLLGKDGLVRIGPVRVG